MITILVWLGIVLFGVFFALATKLYFIVKDVTNRHVEMSLNELHAAMNSLLQTPDEVPEPVLKLLQTLNRTAMARWSPWILVRLMKEHISDKTSEKNDIVSVIEGMRPELRDLVFLAVAKWMVVIMNRSIFALPILSFQLRKVLQASGSLSTQTGTSVVRYLPWWNGSGLSDAA